MKITYRLIGGLFALAIMSVASQGADLGQSYRSNYCPWHEASDILTLPSSEIQPTVQRYADEAAAELLSETTIVSTRPAYVWASETDYACNKALGYFLAGTLDEESIQKCDCFYRRMAMYH